VCVGSGVDEGVTELVGVGVAVPPGVDVGVLVDVGSGVTDTLAVTDGVGVTVPPGV
jgi:hypothetical protein